VQLENARELSRTLAGELVAARTRGPRVLRFDAGSKKPQFEDFVLPPFVGVGFIKRSSIEAQLAVRGWTREDVNRFLAEHVDNRRISSSELDVAVTGKIFAAPPSAPPPSNPLRVQAMRPVHPGVSIGYRDLTVGTLGALVEVGEDKHLCMLSNNHIFANSAAHSYGSPTPANAANVGDPIHQHAVVDGGTPPHVGTLRYWEPLAATGNVVDAALATCDPLIGWEPAIPHIGLVRGLAQAPTDPIEVRKVGRTTDYTEGTTGATLLDFPILYPSCTHQVCRFNDIIEIHGKNGSVFASGGDSGSLVVDTNGYAVGLLFAGSGQQAFINPIELVRNRLGFHRIKGA
jgi:hypothetical protein